MNNLALDAAQCRLMADVAARITGGVRQLFWQTLPDSIPNLEAHLPALAAAVRDEVNWEMLKTLSSHPLPSTLSPETVDWRQGLVTAWERKLKAAREVMDKKMYEDWTHEYIYSLKGLAQVDLCGMPSGMSCPSVLPTLLKEARYLRKRFKSSFKSFGQFECLAVLAGWRAAPNVLTPPVVLNQWGDFWLELYHKGNMETGGKEPADTIILKGIAAKALLNLMEAGRKEKGKELAGMEGLLFKSLTMAAAVGGKIPKNDGHLGLLNWQPQDVTRFPAVRLAKLAETLLKRVELSCQDAGCNPSLRRHLEAALEELIRWDRAGLLAVCRINLFSHIATHMSDYMDNCMRGNVLRANLLNQQLCRWLIRKDVSTVKEGKELLQKLETHWQSECRSKNSNWWSRYVAWDGRIQLQRAGLATEPASAFQEDLLKAIENEKSPGVRLVLSVWKPKKDTPDRLQRKWERRWQGGLKSGNEEISRTAAMALLRPDPADDPVTRRQKLRAVLSVLPEGLCPKLSSTEIAHLIGETSVENPNANPNTDTNGTWQFRPNEMRFRVPTEPASPVSTSATVQDACPDRMIQRIPGSEL